MYQPTIFSPMLALRQNARRVRGIASARYADSCPPPPSHHSSKPSTSRGTPLLGRCNTMRAMDVSGVRYQSTLATSTSVLSDLNVKVNTMGLPTAPSPLTTDDFVLQAAADRLIESGLFGYTPSGGLQCLLDLLHNSLPEYVPWCATIACVTVVVRTMLFPANVNAKKFAVNTQNSAPAITRVQQRLKEAKAANDQLETQSAMFDMQKLYKDNGINPLTQILKSALPQGVVFMTYFWALKGMAAAPIAGFETGGILWFNNLCMADPTYILPGIAAVTVGINLYTGIETGQQLDKYGKWAPFAMCTIVPTGVFFWSTYFPAALCVHWCVSNALSVVMAGVFRVPAVSRRLGIPDRLVTKKQIAAVRAEVEGKKASWKDMLGLKHWTDKFKTADRDVSRQHLAALDDKDRESANKKTLNLRDTDLKPLVEDKKHTLTAKQRRRAW